MQLDGSLTYMSILYFHRGAACGARAEEPRSGNCSSRSEPRTTPLRGLDNRRFRLPALVTCTALAGRPEASRDEHGLRSSVTARLRLSQACLLFERLELLAVNQLSPV
jgi:hypothetical protein